MLPLPLPDIDHEATYEVARERFIDPAYVDRLEAGQDEVMNRGVDYDIKGKAGSLHSITQEGGVAPHLQDGDMQRLYKQGLLRRGSDARKIYEKIKLSSPFRICPFCLHRSVKTLDHYLPKEGFGAYSVLPNNLVPCCRDCNTEKLTFNPVEYSESLLHPYYDHVDHLSWLGCEISLRNGLWDPTFFIAAANVDEILRDRLLSHMNVLDLFQLYDVEGSREINETKIQIRRTYLSRGGAEVRNLCLEMAESRAVLASNYWRAVLWQTAASVEEFCEANWAL